jgi:hypothetical protein
MAVDTVLRIKRKRTEDPLQILLTQDEQSPIGTPSGVVSSNHDLRAKRRRVWQLSRSSDARGIPVPLTTKKSVSTATETRQAAVVTPPRFSVRKRKSRELEGRPDENYRRVLDLERQTKTQVSTALPTGEALAPDPRLADMLSEYLSATAAASKAQSQASVEDTAMKDEDYVYDIYYPSATAEAIAAAHEAITSNYGLLEHFNWDELDQLVVEEADSDDDQHDSEDSNAESWVGNDYPDEEDDCMFIHETRQKLICSRRFTGRFPPE